MASAGYLIQGCIFENFVCFRMISFHFVDFKKIFKIKAHNS